MVRSPRRVGGVRVGAFVLALVVACGGDKRGATDDEGSAGGPSAGGNGGRGGTGGATGGGSGSAGKGSGGESGEGGAVGGSAGSASAGRGGDAGTGGSQAGTSGIGGGLGGSDASGGTAGVGGSGADGGTAGIGGGEAGGSGGSAAGAGGVGGASCREVPYDGKIYLVCPHQGLDWFAARGFCQARDLDLISINTEPENLWAYTEDVEGGSIWIGASDVQSEDVWIWVDGNGLINGYTNWQTSQPNDADPGEDCAVLHSGLGDWNDVDCAEVEFGTGPISLICEPP